MVEAISEWIKHIILLALFASFIELLLPSSSMQKFIRVIVGMLIMLAILNPVLDVFENNWSDRQIAAMSAGASNAQAVVSSVQGVTGERERLTVQMYKKELARQINATVGALDGVAEVQTAVVLADENSGSVGKIAKITLYVKGGPGGRSSVNKVVIGRDAEIDQTERLPSELQQKIVKTVTALYQIKANQLEIQQLR